MSTADPPVQSASPYKGLLARHPLVFFFLIAYAGTWLVELPYILSEDGAGLLPFSSPLLKWTSPVTIFLGPFLAAFIMTGVTEGRAGIGRFLRRFVLWLARVCSAPAAVHARSSSREPHPRSPLGFVAPAPVLHALE